MVPAGHRGVVVCGTRRAEQWRDAFREAGIDAVVVETDGAEAEAGACKVVVPTSQIVRANAIVTEVTAGKREFPGPKLSWRLVGVVLAILCLLAWMLAVR